MLAGEVSWFVGDFVGHYAPSTCPDGQAGPSTLNPRNPHASQWTFFCGGRLASDNIGDESQSSELHFGHAIPLRHGAPIPFAECARLY